MHRPVRINDSNISSCSFLGSRGEVGKVRVAAFSNFYNVYAKMIARITVEPKKLLVEW